MWSAPIRTAPSPPSKPEATDTSLVSDSTLLIKAMHHLNELLEHSIHARDLPRSRATAPDREQTLRSQVNLTNSTTQYYKVVSAMRDILYHEEL